MSKTILITGSTDGIGLATAKMLAGMDHTVLIHGRNSTKLGELVEELSAVAGAEKIEGYLADLTRMSQVRKMADEITEKHQKLDVLINNAGVFVPFERTTDERLDVRFVVNTIASYLLTSKLLPIMDSTGRVINLSSAAQAAVEPKAFHGRLWIRDDSLVYAQSKLALTMWTNDMARTLGHDGPAIIAVNPKSMLGSQMVKEAYGVEGHDLKIGAEILCKAALSEEFADASGKYFDNDIGRFADPHPHALDPIKCKDMVDDIKSILAEVAK